MASTSESLMSAHARDEPMKSLIVHCRLYACHTGRGIQTMAMLLTLLIVCR